MHKMIQRALGISAFKLQKTFATRSLLLQKPQQQQHPPKSDRGYGNNENVENRVSDAYGKVTNNLSSKYQNENAEMKERINPSQDNDGGVTGTIKHMAENVAEKATGTWDKVKEEGNEKFQEAKKKMSEVMGANSTEEIKEMATEKGQEFKDKAKKNMDEMGFKAKKTSNKASEKAAEMKENAKESAQDACDTTKSYASDMKKKAEDTAQSIRK